MSLFFSAYQIISWRDFRIRLSRCPICGPTALVRLRPDSIGVRCVRCSGSAIHLSIAQVVNAQIPDLEKVSVYELSSRGAFFNFLKHRCRNFTYSEYYDDVTVGQYHNGTLCEDVQRLTFSDASFDLCTSTEVFEHVPDDCAGFSEICRVLKPGGRFIFTVPLSDAELTIERACIKNGVMEYILPPVYHGDKIRGTSNVLCFRDYGRDILDRLLGSGFSEVELIRPRDEDWWGLGCRVIVARK